MGSRLVAVLLFSLLTGCAIGPNYKRPLVQAPAQHRQPVPVTGPAEKASLSNLTWASLFQDEVITQLVKTALV
jgi:outer membrane protein TolC